MADAHAHGHDHGSDHSHGAGHGHAPSYRGYWIAWFILLILTVVMIKIHNRNVLLAGIGIKSCIIGWWFMHLKHEARALVWTVVLGGLGFVLFLFYLMYFEAAKAIPSV